MFFGVAMLIEHGVGVDGADLAGDGAETEQGDTEPEQPWAGFDEPESEGTGDHAGGADAEPQLLLACGVSLLPEYGRQQQDQQAGDGRADAEPAGELGDRGVPGCTTRECLLLRGEEEVGREVQRREDEGEQHCVERLQPQSQNAHATTLERLTGLSSSLSPSPITGRAALSAVAFGRGVSVTSCVSLVLAPPVRRRFARTLRCSG